LGFSGGIVGSPPGASGRFGFSGAGGAVGSISIAIGGSSKVRAAVEVRAYIWSMGWSPSGSGHGMGWGRFGSFGSGKSGIGWGKVGSISTRILQAGDQMRFLRSA
jgi:hypothetical protein